MRVETMSRTKRITHAFTKVNTNIHRKKNHPPHSQNILKTEKRTEEMGMLPPKATRGPTSNILS